MGQILFLYLYLLISSIQPITFCAPVFLWQPQTNGNKLDHLTTNRLKVGHKQQPTTDDYSNLKQSTAANDVQNSHLTANKNEVGQSGAVQWNNRKIRDYLSKFGYLNDGPSQMLSNVSETVDDGDLVRKALRKFQKFTKLPVTGEFDLATERQMKVPRCHLPDDVALTSSNFKTLRKRKKRYVTLGSKWHKTSLTYNVIDYPSSPELTNRALVDYIIMTSLNDWSAVAPITFQKTFNNSDVKISFLKYDHGDGYPFDGPGGILAHAFMPEYGMLHFDDSEKWTSDSGLLVAGLNLRQVATHEMGHILGLGHTDVTNAVMYPYFSYKNDFRLQPDDLDGIHSLYGDESSINNVPTATTTTTLTPKTGWSSPVSTIMPSPPVLTIRQIKSPVTPLSPPQQPPATPQPAYKWWMKITWLIW